jgi:hypothetical protein
MCLKRLRPGKVQEFLFSMSSRPDRGVHPASCPMGTAGSFAGVKRPGREADHTPPASAEVMKTVDQYFHSPLRLHGIVLN